MDVLRIPLIAIEEHNEAYFVWYYAREAGWLAEADNILLHVDDHADLNLPIHREPVPPRQDLVAAARYTYHRADITNFIWPTVYSGIFNKVYWLRRKHDQRAGSWRRLKLTFVGDRLPFPWRKVETLSLDPLPVIAGEVACEYASLEPGDRLRPSAPLALDIDLDYFFTNRPPIKPPIAYRLEEAFAREIIENPYHWSRVEGNGMTVQRDASGSWALVLRENRLYAPAIKEEGSPKEVISEALTRLGAYLDEFHLRPSLITICRSDYSGYTPRTLVREIEAGIRQTLNQRFEIEEHSLNALLPEPFKIPSHLLRAWPW
jgi:UPF0489 domain